MKIMKNHENSWTYVNLREYIYKINKNKYLNI